MATEHAHVAVKHSHEPHDTTLLGITDFITRIIINDNFNDKYFAFCGKKHISTKFVSLCKNALNEPNFNEFRGEAKVNYQNFV